MHAVHAPYSGPVTRQVFVVRVWRHDANEAWRGQILLVASDLIISFDSGRQLLAYLQDQLRDADEVSRRYGLR